MTSSANKKTDKHSIGVWEGIKIVLYLCWLVLISRDNQK